MIYNEETIGLFGPLMIASENPARRELEDLAVRLTQEATDFQARLPQSIIASLAELIRTMNCYYSNLIEGHNTHPIDIEKAMAQDYSHEPEKRNLQLEARAHIEVQKWIDEDGLRDSPVAMSSVCEIHRQFYEMLPEELCWNENPDTGERVRVVAGEIRRKYVKVGRHIAISPDAIPRFMERLHQFYHGTGKIESLLAPACAHHRLLWIHPFLDGNGRVARLVSYAMLRDALNLKGLWSIARGLARNVDAYKQHLAACDQPRRNDYDGRGNLSEQALTDFVKFFLETCLDQISFMRDLMKPETLEARILVWAAEEIHMGNLPPKADVILKSILLRGELERSEVVPLTGASSRAARRITSALLECGALISDTHRAPLRLAFPAKLAGRWMPNLFPEK